MLRRRKRLQVMSMLMVFMLVVTTILPANAANKQTAMAGTTEAGCSVDPNAYAIYPIPQNITYADGEFVLSEEVAVVAEDGVDKYTTDFLKKVLKRYGVSYVETDSVQTGKTNILLGIKGSKGTADAYTDTNITVADAALFEKTDAYMLDASKEAIVITGKDADSVYYGVATLQMMFSSFAGTKFLNAHIEDFAAVAKRGYIEGFYGAWDFAERADLMRFAGNYKVNSYVYAAKGDAYHTSKWADLYPVETLKEFENLVKVGEETKVKFAWSIHLGSFFSGLDLNNTTDYEARYAKLTAKLEQLYSVGVRKFDVLNDDFGGGSHETVVTVLNRLNKDLKAKGCEPLVYCPQGYNQAWSGNGAELAALRNLDADINIYWTGADVNSPITQDTVNFLKERTNHKPDFWLNYPVNEHAKSGIFLGDITYYARDNVTGLAGFHSNPSRFAYANEVGLYQLAALVWNNHNYSEHANEVWESAFNYLQPEVKDAYLTIARNVANAPSSSRVPGFNESEYLKDKLAAVQSFIESGKPIKDNAEAQELLAEFKHMIDAVKDFRENCANEGLVSDLEPWLKSLDDLAHAGVNALESVMALEDNDFSAAWEKLSSAGKYYDTMYTYLTAEDLPGVYAKAGSRRLAPFVSKAISAAKNTLSPILNPGDDSVNPVLYARIGGVDRTEDANTKQIYDGNETTYGGWQVVQKAGDYYGLDLGRVVTVKDVSILQGMTDTHHDIFHDATLQCSEDGATWTNIEAKVEGARITADDLNLKARYVRYYLNTTGFGDKPDFWTFVREFTVNKKVPEHNRVYTNIDALKTTPLTLSGAEISVRNLKAVQLAPGQYVGIKLVNPGTITGFAKKVSNETRLAFEYSYNETEWKNVPETLTGGVAAKYVRLVNDSAAAVTTDISKIGISLDSTTANPKVKEHNLTNALKEGSFENLFDGDPSTYAWTNEPQKTGQYITVDLGNNIKVYDVQIVTADGNPRFYNAEIQLSSDNSNWMTIAKVENDNSVFEVPYRYVRADAKGQSARYLRIYLTADSGWYLKLHEIEINKSVEADNTASAVISNLDGNKDSIVDGDIATLFAADAKAGSYVEYRISENTNVDQITIVQGKAGTGKVIAKTPSGEAELGILDKSAAIFDTSALDAVTAVRIEWDQAEEIAIYEIFVSKGKNVSDDIGQYAEPIIDEGTEEPEKPEPVNIALGKAVVSSGCEIEGAANEGSVNDGEIATRWDSVHLKGADAVEDAWIYIDLGEEKQYEISSVVVKFYNKVYATDYDLQVSDNAENWTTVDTLTKADGGAAHPEDVFELAEPLTVRYVRLFFRAVNAAAAGNGVALTEFEIYGVEKKEEIVDKTALQEAADAAAVKAESANYTVDSRAGLKAELEKAQAVLDDTGASQQDVDSAAESLQEAVNALQVKITEQKNIGLNKPVEVSGCELDNHSEANINDGSLNTKWDSNYIQKGEQRPGEQSWFVIDLGEQANLIDILKVSYFNLIYPTRYEVQISNNNADWTTVKTLKRESGGAGHPVDEIVFDAPVSARYIKMLFEELNANAAGNGVGVKEAEVLGRYVYETSKVTTVSKTADIVVTEGEEFDVGQLPDTVAVQIAVAEVENVITVNVPAVWNTDSLDMSQAGTSMLYGTLKLNGIANPDGVRAEVKVIVESDEPEIPELDYSALDAQLEAARAKEAEKDNYTPNSYAEFSTAYEAAKAVKDNASTQDVIDNAEKALADAIAKLVKAADKDALNQKILETEEFAEDKDKYTAESYAIFEEARNAAIAAAEDANATQKQVDEALQSLSDGVVQLKEKEVEPEEPTDPEEPTEPEEPTDPEQPTEPEEPTDPEQPTEPEEPTDPEQPTDPKEPPKAPERGTAAKTGDTASSVPIVMLLISGCVMAAVMMKRRTRR